MLVNSTDPLFDAVKYSVAGGENGFTRIRLFNQARHAQNFLPYSVYLI